MMKGVSMPMRVVMVLVLLLIAATVVIGILGGQGSNAVGFANNTSAGFP